MRVERRQGSYRVCTGRIRAIVGRQVETLRSQFFACIQDAKRLRMRDYTDFFDFLLSTDSDLFDSAVNGFGLI